MKEKTRKQQHAMLTHIFLLFSLSNQGRYLQFCVRSISYKIKELDLEIIFFDDFFGIVILDDLARAAPVGVSVLRFFEPQKMLLKNSNGS